MWSPLLPNHSKPLKISEPHNTLQWHHNESDEVSNHQPHDCLLNRLFRHRSKKASTLRVSGLCEGNSPVTGEFPAQKASYAENISVWWRHHNTETGTKRLSFVRYLINILSLHKLFILTQILVRSVKKSTINVGSTSVQVMAWRWIYESLPVLCVWRIYDLSDLQWRTKSTLWEQKFPYFTSNYKESLPNGTFGKHVTMAGVVAWCQTGIDQGYRYIHTMCALITWSV